MKALNSQTLLEDNVQFWREWLNKGKQWPSGIYQVDQLARLLLCLLKGSITPYYAIPAGVVAYSDSEWPADIFLDYWAFALWGHHDEAKDFFEIRVKNLVDYVINNDKKLHRDLHITNLYDYTCGSGYSELNILSYLSQQQKSTN